MTRILVFFVLFLSCCSLSATHIIAVTEDLPPYQVINADGQISGFSVEIVRELARHVNDDITIEVLPWERAYRKALKQPNVLIFSMYRIDAREKLFQWLGKVDENVHYFYAKRNAPSSHVSTIEDAKRKVVAVTENAFEDKQLSKRGFRHLAKVSRPEQLVNMLFSDRVELLFGSEIAIANLTTKTKHTTDELVRLFTIENWGDGLWLAFSKSTDKVTFNKYKKAFDTLAKNGTLANIKKRHLHFNFVTP